MMLLEMSGSVAAGRRSPEAISTKLQYDGVELLSIARNALI